ncbi:glycosyltransferase family 4 protein [Paenibacillus sp. GCM10023252]|uniref:glycosyltransferase family 4 protein n=1 Tax=Paenibacillus sp. GCM10023252 TaxID=3252649 RepID=UPI003612FEDF
MKVAIVHDWLVTYAGAEKVLEELLNVFPEADLFSVVDFLSDRRFIKDKKVKTSFIQDIPFSKKIYRNLLPLMPLAVEQFDLSSYSLIISSSHAVAKGVITGPNQLHISYVHTPIRYAWDLQHQYLREANLTKGFKSLVTKQLLHKIRQWDIRTANGVDYFISNSNYISRRIWKTYRREAEVIYPPVDVESFNLDENKEEYYLTASRMVPYKKMDIIVEAFSKMPDKKLIVIGTGPEMNKIKKFQSSNIKLLGYQSNEVLKHHMQKAKAFVFAAEEDFGITPVEAQACGTPVIAFGKGGALETVQEKNNKYPTGIFFEEQTASSIIQAVKEFESESYLYTPINCRNNAEKFSKSNFRYNIKSFIDNKLLESRLLEPKSLEEHLVLVR